MIKRISAYDGCLGSQRRRRTWQPAKSSGELATNADPEMSEWGNPPVMVSMLEYIGHGSELRELKYLST
jgi:tellurite resistance protein